MWLISGPFDDERPIEENWFKTKLLKPGVTYNIGRSNKTDTPCLYLNSKKISKERGKIEVGNHSEEDASDPTAIPTLKLYNSKGSVLKIGDKDIGEGDHGFLASGNTIKINSHAILTVTWVPVVCYFETADVSLLKDCAALGIKIVTSLHRDMTHYITREIPSPLARSTDTLLTLLTPAHLVTVEWLNAVMSADLTKTYKLPSEKTFLPAIDPSLSDINIDAWAYSPKRAKLFEGLRFVCAVIGSGIGTECKAIADSVTRGGASRTLVDVEKETGEKSSWDTALRKRTKHETDKTPSGCGLILVAGSEAMYAPGIPRSIGKAWDGMVERAREDGLKIIRPSAVVDAILKCDPSLLDCKLEQLPAIPQEDPSQLPPTSLIDKVAEPESEPSQVSTASSKRPRLLRRATSQTPVSKPHPASIEIDSTPRPEPADAPVRRALLKRRAQSPSMMVNSLLGLDDDSISSIPIPQSTPVAPTPARPSRSLKRRAGTGVASQLQSLLEEEEDTTSRPLKKFRALFEGTLEEPSQMNFDEDAIRETAPGPSPIVLREGEEECLPMSSQTQRQKRTVDDEEGQAPQSRKKRAIEGRNSVEPQSQAPSQPSAVLSQVGTKTQARKPSAKSGLIDTDQSFLQVVASRKGSKQDAFDREFNNLRISKPDPTNFNQAVNKNWEALNDLTCDMNIRGNFMQIVPIEVTEREKGSGYRRRGDRVTWEGREDFKKFKKKSRPQWEIVELILHECTGGGSQPPQMEFDFTFTKLKAIKGRRKREKSAEESLNAGFDEVVEKVAHADDVVEVAPPTPPAGPEITWDKQQQHETEATEDAPRQRVIVMEDGGEDDEFGAFADDDDSQFPVAKMEARAAEIPVKAASKQPIPSRQLSSNALSSRSLSPLPESLPANITTKRKTFQPLFVPGSDDDDSFSLPPTQVRNPEPSQSLQVEESPTPNLDLTYRSISQTGGATGGTQATMGSGMQGARGARGTKRKTVVLEDSGEEEQEAPSLRRGKRRK